MMLPLSEISTEAFFTVNEQTELFLMSVLLGGVFGVVYDVFRALRVIFPTLKRTVPTALCDILFFIICGFGIYIFSLTFARGEIRGYYWIGALLGGIIYLMTAGTVVIGIIRAVFGTVYGLLNKLYIKIKDSFTKLTAKIYAKIRTKKESKIVANAEKTEIKPKIKEKHLKSIPKILYNNKAKMKKV